MRTYPVYRDVFARVVVGAVLVLSVLLLIASLEDDRHDEENAIAGMIGLLMSLCWGRFLKKHEGRLRSPLPLGLGSFAFAVSFVAVYATVVSGMLQRPRHEIAAYVFGIAAVASFMLTYFLSVGKRAGSTPSPEPAAQDNLPPEDREPTALDKLKRAKTRSVRIGALAMAALVIALLSIPLNFNWVASFSGVSLFLLGLFALSLRRGVSRFSLDGIVPCEPTTKATESTSLPPSIRPEP